MGYTHFLSQVERKQVAVKTIKQHPNFPAVMAIMEAIAIECEGYIKASKYYEALQGGKHYEMSKDNGHIWFTGFETLSFPDPGFMFCKTGREPYDIAVVACYHVAQTLLPDVYQFSSDGEEEDLEEGRALGDRFISKYIMNKQS